MSFTAAMGRIGAKVDFYEEVGRTEALVLRLKDGLEFGIDIDRLSTDRHKRMLNAIFDEGRSHLTELYILSKVFQTGPKVFRFKQFDFEMLEHMRVNIDFDDYVQPFDTIIIELPDNYTKNKRIMSESYNSLVEAQPVCILMHHSKVGKCILTYTLFSHDSGVSSCIAFKSATHPIDIIEDGIVQLEQATSFKDSKSMSKEEWDVTNQVIRSGINACLLLDEVGIKRLGPNNQSYYDRLQRQRQKAKTQDEQRRISSDIRRHPIIYAFDHEVELYKTVERADQLPSDSESTRTMSPHHRRGHYRLQPYGPNNSLRKRKRIPPVFVNAHLFMGKMANAKTTYHD